MELEHQMARRRQRWCRKQFNERSPLQRYTAAPPLDNIAEADGNHGAARHRKAPNEAQRTGQESCSEGHSVKRERDLKFREGDIVGEVEVWEREA